MFSFLKGKKIGLGARVAEYLRVQYDSDRAKRIAADFDVSPGTAKRWLKGIAPTSAILEEMAHRWGPDFVLQAFSDFLKDGDPRIAVIRSNIVRPEPPRVDSSQKGQKASGRSLPTDQSEIEDDIVLWRRVAPDDNTGVSNYSFRPKMNLWNIQPAGRDMLFSLIASYKDD